MPARLYADEGGDGAATVVFLHGFGAIAAVWTEIAGRVGESCRTLAYDLPGHGRSLNYPEAGPPRHAAKAVLGDLAKRKLPRVHIVGHSMGGAVAVLMALAEASRVASLTLLAPGGFGEEINARLLRRHAEAKSTSEIQESLIAMSGPSHPKHGHAVGLYASMRARKGQTEKLMEIATVMTAGGRQGALPRERLESLEMPVTLVWGNQDPVLSYQQTRALPPGFVLHPVPGAGHMLPVEAPTLVAEIVRRAVVAHH